MPLEIFEFITSLVRTNPTGTDGVNQGDDHIRGVKQAVQDSFPNIDAAVTVTPAELNSVVDKVDRGDFTGMVAPFAQAANAPGSAWLFCDGSAVTRVGDNTALFNLIGETYGNGDGSTTFNLPDYRGEFLRGQDAGAGNDPDAAGRTDRGDGTTGDEVGTKQAPEFGSHTHEQTGRAAPGATTGFCSADSATGPQILTTGAAGGNETRPRNINVRYHIHL